MRLLLANVFLALVWVAISGSLSLLNLIFGFILGLFGLVLIREQLNSTGHITRTIRILKLTLLFFKELAISAWTVAAIVIKPKIDVKPGIFALPLDVTKDGQITLLANMITLTPGTLSVDVSDDRKTLYVHALDCTDPDEARRSIKEGFERRILEAFE